MGPRNKSDEFETWEDRVLEDDTMDGDYDDYEDPYDIEDFDSWEW